MAIEILRPNGTGDDSTGFTANGAATKWECIDESSPDDDTTYVANSGSAEEIYALQNTALTTEKILNVNTVMRSRNTTGGGGSMCSGVRLSATNVLGPLRVTGTSYETHNSPLLQRPGGGAWIVGDLNSLQVYVFQSESGAGNEARTTQAYVEVEYTANPWSTIRVLRNIVGFETGDGAEKDNGLAAAPTGCSIQSTTKRSGTYALRVNPSAAVNSYAIRGFGTDGQPADFLDTTLYSTFYIRVASLPASTMTFASFGVGASQCIELRISSGGAITLYDRTTDSSSAGTITADGNWHEIRFKAVRNGTCELIVDSGAAVTKTGLNNAIGRMYLGSAIDAVTYDLYFDDVAIAADDYCENPSVVLYTPTGAGTDATGFDNGTGTTFAEIDDIPPDNGITRWSETTVGATAFRTAALSLKSGHATPGDVYGVKCWGIIDHAGFQNAALRVRNGANVYDAINSTDPGANQMCAMLINHDLAQGELTLAALEDMEVGMWRRGSNDNYQLDAAGMMVLSVGIVTPEVTDVQPRQFSNGDIVEITGTGFKANQGNGKVELGDNHQHNLANKVEQNIDHWEDLAIRFIANKGSLPNGQVFVFVTNDDGETNDPPPPDDPGDLGTEIIGTVIPGSGGSLASTEKRLEIIYAAVAGHTVPDGAGRSVEFLMQRIGRSLGINITSGTRSFETNLILLHNNLTGETYSGNRSVNSILSAIESYL